MKIDFEMCPQPMPMNFDTVKFLAKKGSMYFVILRKTETRYSTKTYRDEKVVTEKIGTLDIHPNVTILEHDVFYDTRYRDTELLGYCPIEFPSQYKNINI